MFVCHRKFQFYLILFLEIMCADKKDPKELIEKKKVCGLLLKVKETSIQINFQLQNMVINRSRDH